MNGLVYSLAPIDDLVRFWRSGVVRGCASLLTLPNAGLGIYTDSGYLRELGVTWKKWDARKRHILLLMPLNVKNLTFTVHLSIVFQLFCTMSPRPSTGVLPLDSAGDRLPDSLCPSYFQVLATPLFWRSKVAAGRRAGEGIHGVDGRSPSSSFYSFDN